MIKKTEKRKILIDAAVEAVHAKTGLMEKSGDAIIDMAAGLARVIKKGGAIYLAGNGGSAADCQHFAAELMVRLTGKFERPSLPAVSLTSDSSLLTAAGNDYGFEKIFARQVESLLRKRDILVLISTSGNSENLIHAARAARQKDVPVYALLGNRGGKLKKYADKAITVPSNSVQHIQEEHIFIIHSLVQLMEKDLFG
jgi:D-sedoheptulose 7-phosphate isomerase